MANICDNEIMVITTDSEWNEISKALSTKAIDWSSIVYEDENVSCSGKDIKFSTRYTPIPWTDGQMSSLSKSYPTALFHYSTDDGGEDYSTTWFCYGNECDLRDAYLNQNDAYKAEVKRFSSSTNTISDGIQHRVEIMPDGRVAADGENRFGECNVLSWNNIIKISCGNWHTVGLKKDGTLVACGSNYNGQCNISKIPGKIVDISCGRYHTAILLDTGKVIILGKLENDNENAGVDEIEEDDKYFSDMINGEDEEDEDEDYDDDEEEEDEDDEEEEDSEEEEEDDEDEEDTKKDDSLTANYPQKKITSWPKVVKIKSIYDAVIGVTADGKMFVDGFCPCSKDVLKKIMGVSKTRQTIIS